MAADIQNLTEQNNQVEKVLSSMGKNKGAEAAIKQVISITTAEIKILTDKVASNELKQQKLGDQITTLFKAAQSELQQIQETSP
jgi:hypothetical protein